jgi:omega-hydroxy-beta-dihydromenaquinone-9 sulfotransferase
MTDHHVFRLILIVGFVTVLPVGIYHRLKAATFEKLDRRQEGLFLLLSIRLLGLVQLAIILTFLIDPSLLAWSSVPVPMALRWAGVGLGMVGSTLFVWTLHNLGKNLTDTVVTRKEHSLVTTGPYRWVRHPFYTSFAVAVVAISLVTANWLLLVLGIVHFLLFVARTRAEEEKLVERFGDEYRHYWQRTGRFIPRISGGGGNAIMSWREALVTKLGAGGLAGITLGRWLRVLRDNDFAVDCPYWGRAAVITVGSVPNTLLAVWENVLYRQKIRKTKIDPPLFILGIWRSGTTLLHNLLAQDDRFAYPNTYQVSFPQTFLTTEKINARLMGFFLPKKRPMDNVTFGFAEPQEDEFALWPLIGGFTMGWAFPRRAGFYNRYLTLRHVSANELAEWKAALTWFLQKLAFKYGKPLVLKSPGHTCRIKVLLELFPEARFVHIHRNPLDVFRSSEHWLRVGTPVWTLQRPDHRDLNDRIIRQYKEVYDAFFEECGLIPKGHFHEVGFEELEADPTQQVQGIYEALALPDFKTVLPRLQRYVVSLASYKKNVLPDLPAELQARIAREWRRSFEEWGYAP